MSNTKTTATTPSSPLTTGTCTILWSTQGGRAKACARRTARIIRTEQQLRLDHDNNNDASKSIVSWELPTGYYGSSFDDYGPLEFFKLGNEQPSPPTNHDNDNNDEARTSNSQSCSQSSSSQRRRRLVIMFVSTTGDAEQCDSIQETWKKLLARNIPVHQFQYMTFALFCLGDRAYGPTAFCAAGRKLAARLVQLGAVPYCEIGYGDDGTPNGGVFYDLDVWIRNVLLPVMFCEEKDVVNRDNIMKRDPVGLPSCIAAVPESPPYGVKICMNGGSSSEDRKLEWQMEDYMDSYGNFFSSQCPSTCYFYNVTSGFRISGSQDMARKNDPRQGFPLLGCMVSNQRITAKEWMQDTRHLRIHVKTLTSKSKSTTPATQEDEMSSLLLPYQAGDIVTIAPSNPEKVVHRFLSCLPSSIRKYADCPLHIYTNITTSTQYSSSFLPWPSHATLRGILTYCADICSLPEREDLRALSFYCNPKHPMGVDQRQKLLSLSETSDAALYGDYVLREKRNWADVLFDFDSIQYEDNVNNGDDASGDRSHVPLSMEHLLMILPAIVPRHFSIASAPSSAIKSAQAKDSRGYTPRNGTFGFDLELCVAVVQGKTRYGREYHGLCSTYLASLECSSNYNIRLWIKPGSFGKLPLEMDENGHYKTPIMCIGAGTGVAPLRSLLHEREACRKLVNVSFDRLSNADDAMTSKNNILVFGCRKPSMDFYYEKEWEDLQKSGNLKLLVAFSQNQQHKVYVQKVLREASLVSRHILENNGAVFIAGSAKMARAVKDEIIECLSKQLPLGEKGVKDLLHKLQKRGKFCVEAWS